MPSCGDPNREGQPNDSHVTLAQRPVGHLHILPLSREVVSFDQYFYLWPASFLLGTDLGPALDIYNPSHIPVV